MVAHGTWQSYSTTVSGTARWMSEDADIDTMGFTTCIKKKKIPDWKKILGE